MDRAAKIIEDADRMGGSYLEPAIGLSVAYGYLAAEVRKLCAELELDSLPYAIRNAGHVRPDQAKELIDAVADALNEHPSLDYSEACDSLQQAAEYAAGVYPPDDEEAAQGYRDNAREIDNDDRRAAV